MVSYDMLSTNTEISTLVLMLLPLLSLLKIHELSCLLLSNSCRLIAYINKLPTSPVQLCCYDLTMHSAFTKRWY